MNDDLKKNIEKWKSENRLLMECVAGSHLYNLNTESSDLDIRGVFAPTLDELISGEYPGEFSDNDQDIKYYSLPKFIKLASECNPNIIELLFVPENKIRYKSNAWDELLKFRDLFLSKRAKYTFSGYAYAQIKKSRGEGKKANSISEYVNEEEVEKMRKLVCLSKNKEENKSKILRLYGTNFLKFLEKKSIESKKEFCEDSSFIYSSSMLPPSHKDFIFWYKTDSNGFQFRQIDFTEDINSFDASRVEGATNLYRLYKNGCGFFSNNGHEIILTSISKEREISDFAGVVMINLEAYNKAKSEYDSFWEWMSNRNETRYAESWDKEKTCDMKNLMHCMRLLICAESIASGKGPKVEFNGEEKDFLLKIRRGDKDANKILDEAEKRINNLEILFDRSNLPHSSNVKKIHELVKNKVYRLIYNNLKESFFH